VEGAGGHRSVLRVHREGYHSRHAIACELAWMDALRRDTRIDIPVYILGKNAEAIQQAGGHFLVMFQFIDGDTPDESKDMTQGYEALGALAARCHLHALSWNRPQGFERLTWDTDAVFGPNATWGDWRDAPGVTPPIRGVLKEVETQICARLTAYGTWADRFNLIHADMRFANLLLHNGQTRLIDFDDCGFGWLMYDFAAAVSFIEDAPEIPVYKAAWLRGYQKVRPLTPADIAEIDTCIMLRRMALLAWIGSHMEAPEPQALAPDFAAKTAMLGQSWLHRCGA